MAPRVRVGDYVRVDPRRGGETVVRLLIERDERRLLRALDERGPERTVDAGGRQVTSTTARPEGAQGLAVDQVTEAVAALDISKNTTLNQCLSGVYRVGARRG